MKITIFRKILFLLSTTGLLGILTLSPVKAQTVCQVTDPTGTPLNVRDQPNGQVINTLKNGRQVDIIEISYDSQNRAWARIGGSYKGKYRVWGYVIREFISCYQQ
ncbi:SH3 domain-containing protein [Nostoc sp. KVJ3]|uniref:SH3 domain-containing protein n=1 Tax=Nostoc sp. KVJ3 TaxID=457945 RepID=UPI002237796E|nr:SH3 domain-containing protein [Nostoc sp. KVJ3]MCW5312973.1 SH3 domain-containing protein [Nostoc sp. KVJ3]